MAKMELNPAPWFNDQADSRYRFAQIVSERIGHPETVDRLSGLFGVLFSRESAEQAVIELERTNTKLPDPRELLAEHVARLACAPDSSIRLTEIYRVSISAAIASKALMVLARGNENL